MAKLIFPSNGYSFDTHTEEQNVFIKKIREEGIDEALRWLKEIQRERELSYPASLTLRWESEQPVLLEISKAPDFSNAKKIVVEDEQYLLENLELGCTYYWRIDGGAARSFQTLSDFPRFLRIDGVRNVRDLGGNKIKQGILFRGSELDTHYAITEKGKKAFCEDLGIKADLDLRGEACGKVFSSAAGEQIDYVQLQYRPYKEIFEDCRKWNLRNLMEFLSDESHYPIYFHCFGGADRTGMLAIYLRALAGESEEDIFLDYELTSLARIPLQDKETVDGFRSHNFDYFTEWLSMLKSYAPTGSFREQLVAFFEDCGISKTTLEKIQKIIRTED